MGRLCTRTAPAWFALLAWIGSPLMAGTAPAEAGGGSPEASCTVSANMPATAQAYQPLDVTVTLVEDYPQELGLRYCDGEETWPCTSCSTYASVSPTFTARYEKPGTYGWRIQADDNLWCPCYTSGSITITPSPCQITCTATVPSSTRRGYPTYASVTAQLNACYTTTPMYHIEWGDGTTDTEYTGEFGPHAYQADGTFTWKITVAAGSIYGTPEAVCVKMGTLVVGGQECLEVGQLRFCADQKSTSGNTTTLTGNVKLNDKLFFAGTVTFTGTPASGSGTLATDGNVFVTLQSGDKTLLKGPGLTFRVDGGASKLFPTFADPKAAYAVALAGVPLLVNGAPITLQDNGVVTESTFWVGVLDVFTLVQAKATELYPPGGKRKLLSAQVVNGEVVPSVKFLDMSLTYDPDLDKLEGKMSVGFPFIKDMWSIDLAVRVVQGCFNGMDLTLPLASGIPLGTTGLEVANLTVRMDNICVGQFTIFLGGDLNQLVPPIPSEFFQIKDVGLQYYYPLSLEVKGGTMTILGYPMQETSGRVNLNSFSGTFKTRGNILDVLQGEIRFDLIIPKAWFMGRYSGKLQIPDFQCAWTSLTCRAMRTLLRSAVTLPYVINQQSLEFNADYNQDGTSYGFFRGMVNLPLVGSAAVLVETRPGELHLLVGTNFENLFEVTESDPARTLRPESAEQVLVLDGAKDSVVFAATSDALVPSLYLRNPAGATITPANAGDHPGVTYASDEGDKVALFRVADAPAGTWTLGADNLSAGQVTFLALAPKPAPETSFSSVVKDGARVSITAAVAPASSQTTVTLLYSRSDDGSAEGVIAEDLQASTGSVSANWDTANLPTGSYFILARTDDGMNPPVTSVYPTPVAVDQGILLAPSGLSGTREGASATLAWTPSATPSAAGHTVLYTDDLQVVGYPYTAIPEGDGSTTLRGLDPEKGYRLCVVAYDREGNLSPPSNALTFAKPGSTPGDCDGDGTVSIGEVQRAINMFLGTLAPDCSVDVSGDGTVSIGEVQQVVNAFLGVVPGVAVSVVPSAATVTTGGTKQFEAAVTGTTNTAVHWSVQEGSAGGSVTASGLYTAPPNAGVYHVKATSQADSSRSGSATVTVTQAPTCTLTCAASANPASGQAPLGVSFSANATATGCSGGTTFSWAFGDGATSTQQSPTHTYASAGTYGWSVTVSASGVTCSKSGSITVAPPPDGTPLALGVPVTGSIAGSSQNASWNWYYLDAVDARTFAVDVSGLTGDVDLYVRFGEKPDLSTFYCRSWNSGTASEHCAVTATGPSRIWVGVTNYGVGGPFQYSVTATDGGAGGCTFDSCQGLAQVEGMTVTFISDYQTTGCTDGATVLWFFGDGGSSTEPVAVHTYAAPGNYGWTLGVGIGDQACTDDGVVQLPGM